MAAKDVEPRPLVGEKVRLSYPIEGSYVAEIWTITGEDACHYFVEANNSHTTARVPHKNVRKV
jgi:hypothetical protein